MQSYPLTLDGTNTSAIISANGDLFVYQRGTTIGNAEISVKSDVGGEIDLIPGQRFRIPEEWGTATRWTIKSKDGVSIISGKVIIGSGEFDDANTLNKFTLDASLANNVTVNNTTANRVPVSLDTSQTLNLASNVLAYTTSYTSAAASAANVAINMLPAASNVNGAVMNKFDAIINAAANTPIAVLAKATAPTSFTDGDVLFVGNSPSTGVLNYSMDIGKAGQPRVPAGKGVWYITNQNDGCIVRDALFTVL